MKTTGFLSEMDRYLFGHGTHYEIYKKLGGNSYVGGLVEEINKLSIKR